MLAPVGNHLFIGNWKVSIIQGYRYLEEREETGSDNRAFLYLYGTALLRV
jgi:hypothetical protein